MSKIKWISESVSPSEVKSLLNLYSDYIIPESVLLTPTEPYIVVTFLLRQTFNSLDELNSALNKAQS